MSFTNPLALVLLLAIPVILYIGWPRFAYRRRRDTTSLVLRILIVSLISLALAGTQISRAADKLAVIFLVDHSDSMGAEIQDAQLEYVRQSIQNMGPDDVSGVIVFGANAVPEHPVNNVRELPGIQSIPTSTNTDIAEAIRLGLALFPNDAARRMVILSDGRATVGDTEAAVQLAAATGVEISYVAFAREQGPEVQVTDLSVPTTVTANQPFDIYVTIDAEQATDALVTLSESGRVISRTAASLNAGSNNVLIPYEDGTDAGFKEFSAQVMLPEGSDSFDQNNRLSAISRVTGPPRVLLVSTSESETEYLVPALEEAGVTVDRAGPNDFLIGLMDLLQYNSVILANVPATTLTTGRMQNLDTYVKELGGGLIVIGGPNSYGAGGYFQTPLEEALPVETQIRDQQRFPQLTIVYLIDRSGSMGVAGDGAIPNIELAKEAIIRSIDFLQPTDRAGVVSFDSVGYWIAPIQSVLDRQDLQELVASLRASGGTDILAGMNLVDGTIVDDPSDRKHIILLTDGGANSRGLVELATRLYDENGVTTSVISIGGGAPGFLAEMAAAGHGNYHPVTNVESIPTIFTLETGIVRPYILEQPFVPGLSSNSPIMQGIDALPQLLGYVATSPKQTAQVILRGPAPFNDPVLATWQYGLGRSVAFTSDATARWGANWITWNEFIRFWSQAVRWTITEGRSDNLEMQVVMEGEQARLVVDARDDTGQFLNDLELKANVVTDPNIQSSSTQLDLRQIAPGRYEAVFTPQQEGAYFMTVTNQGAESNQPLDIIQQTGWVMSYSPEYDIQARGADLNLLNHIASLTNGHDMSTDPTLPFVHNLTAQNANTLLWPWFLLAVLLLLPLDIGVRRLIITLSDLQRARDAILGRVPAMDGPSERLSTLIGAKERGRQRAEEVGGTDETIGALRARRDQSRAEREAPTVAAPPANTDMPRYSPSKSQQRDEGSNIAGELLKRRKERK